MPNTDGNGETETTTSSPQQECDEAVEAKYQQWHAAKLKMNRGGYITVSEEVDVRQALRKVEATIRGLPLSIENVIQPVQTINSFLEQTIPPKEPLIDGLLYRRDIVAFAGRRRHGKTTFAGNLALALTLPHSDFLGYVIPMPRRVLAFFLEDDAGELQIKLKHMYKDQIPEDRLAIYTREDFYRASIPIGVTDLQFQEFVTRRCVTHRPDVIMLDNLAHLVTGDYNNSKLIHALNKFVWQLTVDFNAAIFIPAHPRKRDNKNLNSHGLPVRLRDDPEGFFEDVMGSSHFVNSCGSLWGIERDQDTDRSDFLGGTQRFTGQQSVMTLEKDDDDWLKRVSDFDVNLPLAINTPPRRKAWALLPEGQFSYIEAEKGVKSAMKSASTFHAWFKLCQRLGLIVSEKEGYKKVTRQTT